MATKQYYYGLDLIRFFAALWVAAFHLGYNAWVNPGDRLYPFLSWHAPRTNPFDPLSYGWIGVQVFFVISGVVIAHSMANESISTFIRRRFLRLAPTLWISIVICSPIIVLFMNVSLGQAALLATKTAIFFPTGPWTMGQFWTLPVEIGFYAAIVALMFTGQVAKSQLFAGVIAAVSTVYWLTPLADVVHQQPFRELLLQHGMYFSIGVTMFRALQTGWTRGGLAVFMLCVFGAYLQIGHQVRRDFPGLDDAMRTHIAFMIWAGITTLLLVSLGFSQRIAQALSGHHALLRLIGLSTYPLYLIHYEVGDAVILAGQALHLPVWASVTCALVIAIALSAMIAQWIEPAVRGRLATAIELFSNRQTTRLAAHPI